MHAALSDRIAKSRGRWLVLLFGYYLLIQLFVPLGAFVGRGWPRALEGIAFALAALGITYLAFRVRRGRGGG